MNPSRSQQQSFALRYFGTNKVRLTTIRHRVQQTDTLIIDTDALTSGRLLYDRAIVINNSMMSPLHIAHMALAKQDDSSIAKALPKTPMTGRGTVPVAAIQSRVTGTIWHNGETYTGAWIGKPTSIAHNADMTDTERERFLLQCRELAAHGSAVYAVASSSHGSVPSSYAGASSTIIGLLVFHPVLFHGTEQAIAQIHQSGIKIIYASKDSEHTVELFATASLLAPNHPAPFVYRPGRTVPSDGILFSSLSDKARETIVNRTDAVTTLTIHEPLPEFWRLFSTFL